MGDSRRPKVERGEGQYSKIACQFDPSKGARPSGLQIIRNYQNAIRKVGGEKLWEADERMSTLKIAKDGREIWVDVSEYGGAVGIVLVQREAVTQHVVADSAAFAAGLRETGHATVYGIHFDTGSAVVKPESEPTRKEIAKLPGTDPGMKLWVVGHTDWVGGLEPNMKLSTAQAASVVKELTARHGIAAPRLAGQGMGLLAPVATNATDEGRARNRRVEMVMQP